MRKLIRNFAQRFGYDIVPYQPATPLQGLQDLSPAEHEIIRRVRSFTMTSLERLASLLQAVAYVHAAKIPGDFVECGVWRGGSTMAAALMFIHLGDTSRHLHLFDTFQGMSEPTDSDKGIDGTSAEVLLAREKRGTGIWCHASLEDVKRNLASTGYPADKITYHQGKVEDTVPTSDLSQIALLRLDTDWYESTHHELRHLYPLLSPGGPLIIDDYGHWSGARKAVDEYLGSLTMPMFLHRIDYTGRLCIKPRA